MRHFIKILHLWPNDILQNFFWFWRWISEEKSELSLFRNDSFELSYWYLTKLVHRVSILFIFLLSWSENENMSLDSKLRKRYIISSACVTLSIPADFQIIIVYPYHKIWPIHLVHPNSNDIFPCSQNIHISRDRHQCILTEVQLVWRLA